MYIKYIYISMYIYICILSNVAPRVRACARARSLPLSRTGGG